jgi:uncharacterized protein YjbI with pentapeptide repeats
MSVTRRTFFNRITAMAAVWTGPVSAPRVLKARRRKISQVELSAAIEQHALWLDDSGRGARAIFNDCDLTGLDFQSKHDMFVDLRGSDFTGADLTGVAGKDVSFLWASLQDARLSWSRLERPTFSYANLWRAECDNVIWGWEASSLTNPRRADPIWSSGFQHTYAGKTNFARATLRGFLNGTRFVGSNLADANLSYSEFSRTGFHVLSG